MSKADLSGAIFINADLRDSNLSGAIVARNYLPDRAGIDPNATFINPYLVPEIEVISVDFTDAKLDGATMPDGKKFKS
jgi:uncharacterized protein YjbI with pentapeptide repeats